MHLLLYATKIKIYMKIKCPWKHNSSAFQTEIGVGKSVLEWLKYAWQYTKRPI